MRLKLAVAIPKCPLPWPLKLAHLIQMQRCKSYNVNFFADSCSVTPCKTICFPTNNKENKNKCNFSVFLCFVDVERLIWRWGVPSLRDILMVCALRQIPLGRGLVLGQRLQPVYRSTPAACSATHSATRITAFLKRCSTSCWGTDLEVTREGK